MSAENPNYIHSSLPSGPGKEPNLLRSSMPETRIFGKS